jgi:MFS family permease
MSKSSAAAPHMFRALRHRNYRLFFSGQLVSLVGSFLTLTTTSWLVLRLTQSARMLGIVAFSGQIAMFVLAPFAGVWVDRLNRRRLLVITQTLAMLESFALAALALSHRITVGEIIALNLFQGAVNAFDMPGRQAFLLEMVAERDDLANAIALNSIMVHGARLIGPALAGLLIALVGEGLCFTIDGVSYIGVILALLAMRVAPRVIPAPRSVAVEMRQGLSYIWHFLPIRILLIVMAAVSVTGFPALSVLMPLYAAYFAGATAAGAKVFGLLGTCVGLGALIGALYLASRKTVVGLGRLIVIGSFVFSVALAVFGVSRLLWLSLLILPLAGWGMFTFYAGCNTILQTVADDDKRGRVMSFFTMAFAGMTPFGNLLAGELAAKLTPAGADHVVGAMWAQLIAATVCLGAAIGLAFSLPALRRAARPIYVQKGILPAAQLPPTVAAVE